MSAKICPQCGTRYEGDNRFCTIDGATLVNESPTESLTGTMIADRYHISKKLGEGGMGEVYLAEHVRMKRKVAVKVMRKALTSDPAAIGRFHREAENASQITHTNVAAVYDFGDTGEAGLVYLAMEFVDGEPLTDVLVREKQLNHIRASDVVTQIAEALAAAHSLGILHRDLKPDNVMIAKTRSNTDMVKLLDFGIARVMGRETQHFTSTGLVVGTPEWMSPEQIAGDELTTRADIYALGLIAFRALTGEGAFGGSTSQEVLLNKMTKAPRLLSDVRPDVEWPEPLQQAMNRVLSNNPAERYEDALVFAADFYAGVSAMPMTPEAEAYLHLLQQRAVTPVRLGTIEATPPRPMPTLETPVKPMKAVDVPQLANTMAVKAADLGITAKKGPVVSEPAVPTAGVDGSEPAPPPAETATAKLPLSRTQMLGVGGVLAVALIAFVVMQSGGGTPAGATSPDSATVADSGAGDSSVATTDSGTAATPVTDSGTTGGRTTTPAPVASRPATPGLDSAANRHRASIFTIMGEQRGAGFLADSSGIVLTASSLVGNRARVEVFLDGGRRVIGQVARVDGTQGLAAVVIPTRQCPTTCAPVPMAPDRARFRAGDTVMAVMPQTLVSSGARSKGTVTNASARGFAASVNAGVGAPVFLPDGNVLAVSRGSEGLVPASVARAFLREAASAGVAAVDSVLPSWPSRPVSAEAMAEAVRRTSQDLDRFRVPARNDFEALVMSPQILAYRRAEVDTMKKYFNPGSPASQYCDGTGFCDPIEAWGNLGAYLSERRAVVVIQVTPQRLQAPRRGERALADMNRRQTLLRATVSRGGQPLPILESHRIYSAINPASYPENQREALYSGLLVLSGEDFLGGTGAMEITVSFVGGSALVRLPIPASVVEAIRADLASAIR